MGVLKSFTLSQSGICSPLEDGSIRINGFVNFSVTKTIKVNYIKVKFSGESLCCFRKKSGSEYRKEPVKLVKVKKQILTSLGKKAHVFDAGSHKVPFSIYIKPKRVRKMPSTWQSREHQGKIQYQLHAKMDRAGKLSDEKAKPVWVTIINPPIYGAESKHMKPRACAGQYYAGFLCMVSNPVIVRGTVSKSVMTGWSDDKIIINLTIDNMRSHAIKPKAFITEKATQRTQGAERSEKYVFCHTTGRRIEPFTSGNVVQLILSPEDGLSGTISCIASISVAYYITVMLEGTSMKKKYPMKLSIAPKPVPADPRV